MKVFWELTSIRYFVTGVMVFSLYHLMLPFITWWLGAEYALSHTILILLLVNILITQTRGVVDNFNHAYGLYADTWSAWAEGIINIGVTIAAATQWGIVGILLGKIVSTCIIVVVWKPYYLFSQGLKIPIRVYWSGTIRYYIAFIISFVSITFIAKLMPFQPDKNIQELLLYAVCTVIPFIVLYFILIIFGTQGMLDVLRRVPLFNKILQFKQ